jgi:hypothetical protein
MSGSYNRQKGHEFEREIAEDFRTVGFPKAKTSRAASRLADDCKIDIVGVFPYAPQCKNTQTYASTNRIEEIAWQQYVDGTDGLEGRKMIPLLIARAKGAKKPDMVTLPWEAFKDLLTKAHGKQN